MSPRSTTIGLLAILGVSSLIPTSAAAQVRMAVCGERDKLTSGLTARYGETFAGGGLRNETTLVEVWASEQTGTWSVVIINANGIACITATGSNWSVPSPAAPKDPPATPSISTYD